MEMKKCRICGGNFPITDFYKCKGMKDELQAKCKFCADIKTKEWYQKNKRRMWAANTLRSHKERGCIIETNRHDLLVKANKIEDCEYCGCQLDWNYGNGINPNNPTLDRINNDEKIIHLFNTKIICRSCNSGKLTLGLEEWLNRVRDINSRRAEILARCG